MVSCLPLLVEGMLEVVACKGIFEDECRGKTGGYVESKPAKSEEKSKNARNHFRCKPLIKRFEGETAVSLKHPTELKTKTHWTEFEVHLTEKRD